MPNLIKKSWTVSTMYLFLITNKEFSRIFLQYRPSCPNSPKTEISYHQKPLNAELGIYRVGNKFSDTLNVPYVSNWFMSVKLAVNCKF